MAHLLLELFSEEIPARMQARAAEDLKSLVTAKLKAAGLDFAEARADSTARRLTLSLSGLPMAQADVREEKKGPRVGSPDKAIDGFLKGAGLASLDQAEKRDTGKGEFWFAVTEKKGQPTSEVLPALLTEAIAALPWPKSMRSGTSPFRWVRPLHGIIALFDRRILALEVGGVKAGDTTLGHRFLSQGQIQVTGAADYRAKLADAHVVLRRESRAAMITEQAETAAARDGLEWVKDPALLEEVVGLVEWPVVLTGALDPAYIDLPPEVLTTSMRTHQKYFALRDGQGRIPRFLVVANMLTKDGGKTVIAGNEKVLRARLSDARFFWDEDRKHSLASRVSALKDIVFHAKLGTLADKVARVEALAREVALFVHGADPNDAARAAHLCKADLTTGMVGEFPELQGVMGRYYARHDGEDPGVAEAIALHYQPAGNTACPSVGDFPLAVALGLADRLDTLAGFFAIDEKPTGSKDPFALRRAALGVIRLILENRLRVALKPLLLAAVKAQPAKTDAEVVVAGFQTFLADRLKVALGEQGVRHDLVNAVFAKGLDDDIVRLFVRVDALKGFLATDDGANLLAGYRRAANILRIEEKRDGKSFAPTPDAAKFAQDEERALYAALESAGTRAAGALEAEDFVAAGAALAGLRQPIDAFFDKVTVNADDPVLRVNRLSLLALIRDRLDALADFSALEG